MKLHTKLLLLLLIIVLFYFISTTFPEQNKKGFFDIILSKDPQSIPYDQGELRVCFNNAPTKCITDSQNNTQCIKYGACDELIISLLNISQESKAALYDVDVGALVSIMKEKNTDLLIDEDNYFGFGTEIKGPALMHNKFWIITTNRGTFLLTGSLNPTHNGFVKNDNNLVILTSEYIIENYENEFEELKNNKPDQETVYQKIMYNNYILENYFCPEDKCEQKVLDVLNSAKKNIYFMTFSFTSDPIGNLLIEKKNEVTIKGVFEERQAKSQTQYSEYYKMIEQDMNVKFDNNPNNMHHKVFIIDNSTVITGSYNPTASGNSANDENILIIREPNVVNQFLEEFERVWNE